MEPISGPGTQSTSDVQPVRRSSEQNQEDDNTCDRSTIERDASTDPSSSSSRSEPHSPINHSESLIFNYSSLVITDPMYRLLNRGLNFSLLPLKPDITQTLVEYKRFARSAIWAEFHYGKNSQEPEEKIFKTHKTNMPKNYSYPEGLKTFLSSV